MKTTRTTIGTFLNKTGSLGAALLIMAGGSAFADTNWYITTSHTNAQTQIDTNHLSSWIFTPQTDEGILGGIFILKDGPKTGEDIVLSLYLGSLTRGDLFTGTNTPLTSVVLSNEQFKQQNPTDQQYNPVTFNFTDAYGNPAPVLLSNSFTYTAALTSSAQDTASYHYFIKGGDSIEYVVPEPSTYALGVVGLLGLLAICHHRRTVSTGDAENVRFLTLPRQVPTVPSRKRKSRSMHCWM